MRPRIPTLLLQSSRWATSPRLAQPCPALPSFLVPFLHRRPQLQQLQLQPKQQQHRSASILSSLSDVRSAYNKRIRVGRGPSSGKGKTSGRGTKGQKQHGKVPAGFNGGQTPMSVTHPTKGFVNRFTIDLAKINLDRIQSWIDQGRLDPSKPITVKELTKSRCVHQAKEGVKLLARGSEIFKTPINIIVSRASATAIEAIEAAGGTVTTRFYTANSIKRILRGETDPVYSLLSPRPDGVTPPSKPFLYRLPDPTSRRDIEYYRDPAHRGYLRHLVREGEGPSLLFKPPQAGGRKLAQKKAGASKNAAVRDANRIW